ncbi:SgcJ/EcaC family oxidoreductase [Myxosarcina sp. GI1]|uniref:SgcJ/EcaC family oxidoreductase n=1 Tax=Myxosarcina sp. GI1 TaxID=1541065 RepID=UPI00068F6EDF|nr:SgcJ/EcaC family oxidoreductase [Myxosarcina sp. GI1]
MFIPSVTAQNVGESNNQKQDIYLLIDRYNQARENRDTDLLENILTTDVDQLVSSGEWRRGIETAVEGMLRSSNRNPGKRTITIEQIRFLDSEVAIVDTRYEIKLEDNADRNLWSTFLVVRQEGKWKIAAIRNMSPTE